MALRRAVVALALATLASPLSAHADRGDLDQAIDLYEQGRLRESQESLQAAEQGEGLVRGDVVQLLTYQALIAHASQDSESLQAALLRLATLGEDDAFGRSAPPPVVQAYREARSQAPEALRVEVETTRVPGGLALVGRVVGDLGALVSELRVRARPSGGRWLEGIGGEVTLPASCESLEVVAEARGPGGAVLAHIGRDDEPATLTVEPRAPVPVDALVPPATPPPLEDDTPWVVATVVGAGLFIIGAAVLIGVLVSDQSRRHSIGPPVVVFP